MIHMENRFEKKMVAVSFMSASGSGSDPGRSFFIKEKQGKWGRGIFAIRTEPVRKRCHIGWEPVTVSQ